MFGNPTGGLSFLKILNGLSKTLSIANQVIPLYKEAKPMINNAKSVISVIRELGKETKNSIATTKENSKNISTRKKDPKKFNVSNPSFFL
mgnify:FL=1